MSQSSNNLAATEKLAAQCDGGRHRYGGITDRADLEKNFAENCLPLTLLDGAIPDYDAFLDQRRHLMTAKIKTYFQIL